MVRMHFQHASDPFAVTLCRVESITTRLERSGIDADICQLADVWVRLNLEDESGERLARFDGANLFLVSLWIRSSDRRHIEWGRQIVRNGVEHQLDAFVFQ